MSMGLRVGEPVCVAQVQDWCGEGALWHPEEQTVYWSDINRFLIHRLVDGAVTTWKFAEPVTAIVLTTRPGTLAVMLGSGVVLWRPDEARLQMPAYERLYTLPEWPAVRCNDAGVDPAGVLWVATMQNNVAADGSATEVDQKWGALFSLDGAGMARTWRSNLFIGNTVEWSPDGRRLYNADSLADTISRFDWMADSSVSNEAEWFCGDGRQGLPDGSAMDAEGYLWNCRYGGGCILRIDPEGQVERMVAVPVRNPTTCIFGGADGRTLYVTSAALGDDAPLAGGLFALQTNVRGLAAQRFCLAA